MRDDFRIRAQRGHIMQGSPVELFIIKDGLHCVDVSMRMSGDGEYIPPSLAISSKDAQTLMDDLWVAGLRPSENTTGANHATEKHLSDMRKIVSKKLGVDL